MYEANAIAVKKRGGKEICRTYIFLWLLVLCSEPHLLTARAKAETYANSPGPEQATPPDAEQDLEREAGRSWDRTVPNNVPAPDPEGVAVERGSVAVIIAFILIWLLAVRKLAARLANYLNERYDPWRKLSQVAARTFYLPELAEFFAALRGGSEAMPTTHVAVEPGSVNDSGSGPLKPGSSGTDLLQNFLRSAPEQTASLRKLFAELGRASDEPARLKILQELTKQVESVRDAARQPTLVPVWQLATALVGLLRQLTGSDAHITPSALRTAAMAVDLLESLCVAGLPPDLATKPAVRLLVVDDDHVSRTAISFALSKAFDKPDLIPDSKSAVARLARNVYDVIFLDVEMPGMDGFELCSKIRGTGLNRDTPVVFVTNHSDFQSRAKSAAAGGQELIGKPFLSFEITVKAFTLVLRSRLDALNPKPASNTSFVSASSRAMTGNRPAQTVASGNYKHSAEQKSAVLRESQTPLSPVAVQLKALRAQLESIRQVDDPETRRNALGELSAGIHELYVEAERTRLLRAFPLAAGLEAFLRKVCEQPEQLSGSGVDTIAAALELFPDLWHPPSNNNSHEPPWRFLVVDDDPVSRRATSASLQLTFGRPENADSGTAALALAEEREFDVIFMDVRMPGMDGFSACSKIHATRRNAKTPVVFVTSHDDLQSRGEAVRAGGCSFIVKPVLSGEIRLGALTFGLRNRVCRDATGTEAGLETGRN